MKIHNSLSSFSKNLFKYSQFPLGFSSEDFSGIFKKLPYQNCSMNPFLKVFRKFLLKVLLEHLPKILALSVLVVQAGYPSEILARFETQLFPEFPTDIPACTFSDIFSMENSQHVSADFLRNLFRFFFPETLTGIPLEISRVFWGSLQKYVQVFIQVFLQIFLQNIFIDCSWINFRKSFKNFIKR